MNSIAEILVILIGYLLPYVVVSILGKALPVKQAFLFVLLDNA